MKKPNALKNTLLIAALLCTVKLALDIFFIINNHITFYTAVVGNLGKEVLPIGIKMFFIAESLLATAPLGIAAAINYKKEDMSQKRGISTVIVTGIFYAVYILGFPLIKSILFSLTSRFYGDKILSYVISLNGTLGVTDFLVHAAAVMMISCAAVEIYGGEKKSLPEDIG
ncbi:hypothetical protein [Ruminococcus flavefaciens]|uniref:Uncharacterized protein n=1 Tax=Ruminococcus flavefaciens 007c TaxID=1341157 RepID=W7UCE7_RUMFL|nr:hypothetical protein [Ruminococcus flavefaciens]EWM52746.1 hypothetical protein RF007C_14030 [Ruminococcus flavefaciens 007c]